MKSASSISIKWIEELKQRISVGKLELLLLSMTNVNKTLQITLNQNKFVKQFFRKIILFVFHLYNMEKTLASEREQRGDFFSKSKIKRKTAKKLVKVQVNKQVKL